MKNLPLDFIDLHCDTIARMTDEQNLKSNNLMVDLEKMRKGGGGTSLFALFVYLEEGKSPWEKAVSLHDRFVSEIENNNDLIQQIITKEDYLEKQKNGKLGAILSTEEGGILEGKLERIETLKNWGVRSFTLTWNFENELAYPNGTAGKLKDKGFQAIKMLEEANILVDISHLNDEGISDVINTAKKPFIASHSNARSICDHTRNLTDSQIKALASKGGVMGLNFYPGFVGTNKVTNFENLTTMIKYTLKTGGEDVLALGTDFDGIEGDIQPSDISKLPLLANHLNKEGISLRILEKMFCFNARRVLFNY